MKRIILVGSILLGALPRVVGAQDASAVSSAREAAKSGIADYYAGRYAEAQDKLSRAFAVVPVPTLALYHARALVRTGKLVEASEVYLAATRLKTGDGDAETQEQARSDAKVERAALLKRIPRLHISVAGAPTEKVTVVANGANVPPSLYATGWMVNPGTVQITAQFGTQRFEATEQFTEKSDKVVTVKFETVAPSKPPSVVATSKPNPPPLDPPSPRASTGYRIATWTSLGVGAAGLALGCAAGLWAYADMKKLDHTNKCVGSQCDGAAVGGEVDRYNLLRNLSTTGFIVAAIGGTAGALLYFNAPKPNSAKGLNFTGWIGIASAGIGGSFE